jgi:hypothetical protein
MGFRANVFPEPVSGISRVVLTRPLTTLATGGGMALPARVKWIRNRSQVVVSAFRLSGRGVF